VFGACALAAVPARYAPLPPDAAEQIRSFNPLLVTLGLINMIVVLLINPWREDRQPDRFPTIVQDALVIALFAIVATLFMQEKVLATTAGGAARRAAARAPAAAARSRGTAPAASSGRCRS
jgi:hypothetical protein